jgi:hypothetical protein
MAQTGYTPIQLYHSTTPGAAPTAGNLVPGELAINIADGVLYYEDSGGAVQQFSSGAGKAGGAIIINKTTASESYLFPSGTNGFSVGPITIANGITVTVSSGQRWVVI